MAKEERVFDLEERLIDFAVRVIRVADSLPFAPGHRLLQITVKHKARNRGLILSTRSKSVSKNCEKQEYGCS